MGIGSHEVSVVVQGPVIGPSTGPSPNSATGEVIATIRRCLPSAEIVLSTWQGQPIDGFDVDVAVFSEDPGAIVPNADFPSRRNNVNRQIVSTTAGLGRATRRYAVKLRSDTPLLNGGFLERSRISTRHPGWRLLRERVLLAKELSLHPAVVPSLYHGSDCFQFGLTEDLRSLWSGPLAPEPETSRAFPPGAPPALVYNVVEGPSMRMSAEQYVLVSFLRGCGIRADVSYICDCGLRQAARSLLFMANNFDFASAAEIGLKLPQRITASPMSILSAESDAWQKTTRRLTSRLGARLYLPLELINIRVKWLHFWVRYSLRPKIRAFRGTVRLPSAVRP